MTFENVIRFGGITGEVEELVPVLQGDDPCSWSLFEELRFSD